MLDIWARADRPRDLRARAGHPGGWNGRSLPMPGPFVVYWALVAAMPARAQSSSPCLQTLAPLCAWARCNRSPSGDQRRAIEAQAPLAHGLSARDRYDLLTQILCGRYVREPLQWLLELGILDALLPAVAATSRMGPLAGRTYKDVWEHTKTVVWQAVPTPTVRWAALLHDVGKVTTIEHHADGRVTFMGHERASQELFDDQVCASIAFPEAQRTRISELILHHQRPSQYESEWSDAAVRRFARDMDGLVPELLLLSRADITSRRPGRRKARLYAIHELSQRIEALREAELRKMALPAGWGHAVCLATGRQAGPWIGPLKRRLEAAMQAGELPVGKDARFYIEYASERGWICDTPVAN